MSGEDVVATAAELAERILDEVSSPVQDWGTIALWARELAALADSAAGPPGRGPQPAGGGG